MYHPVVAIADFPKAPAQGDSLSCAEGASNPHPHLVVFRHSVHPLSSPQREEVVRVEGKEFWT